MNSQHPSLQIIFDRFFELGGMEAVNHALGHPYALEGRIIHGRHLGRTVGMPTANLQPIPGSFLPPHGVYATLSWVAGQSLQGLTNVGPRPSVGGKHVTIETFFLNFDEDLYGQYLRIEFYSFIRKIYKMNGLKAVQLQVEQDAINARKIFKGMITP